MNELLKESQMVSNNQRMGKFVCFPVLFLINFQCLSIFISLEVLHIVNILHCLLGEYTFVYSFGNISGGFFSLNVLNCRIFTIFLILLQVLCFVLYPFLQVHQFEEHRKSSDRGYCWLTYD